MVYKFRYFYTPTHRRHKKDTLRTGGDMSKVTITQAAKMAGISRSYFYKKYIITNQISTLIENNKKLIDVSELIRVFGSIQPEDVSRRQQETVKNTQETHTEDKLVTLLQNQLAEAKQREEWLKAQLEKVTALIEHKTPKKNPTIRFW